jgi:hypothetical protein
MVDTLIFPDIPMVEKKPARNYIAKAIPTARGFLAQWAAPGLVPDWVYEGDAPQVFSNEEEAAAKARKVLFDALNSRRRSTFKKSRYDKMTGPELAVAIAGANLSPSEFAALWGTDQDRVLAWFDDAENMGVPFPLWWAVELLKNPDNLALARRIVADHTEARRQETEATVERVERRRP